MGCWGEGFCFMQQLQLLGKGPLCKTGLSWAPSSQLSGGRGTLAGHATVGLKGRATGKGPGGRGAHPSRGNFSWGGVRSTL